MGKLEELPVIWSNTKVKPENPHINDHKADTKKLVRTTKLKRYRQVPLHD